MKYFLLYLQDLIYATLCLYSALVILNPILHNFVTALLPLNLLGWINVILLMFYYSVKTAQHFRNMV